MTARQIPRHKGQPQENRQDNRLSRMVVISAVLHAAIFILLIIFATRGQSGPSAPRAYTVELVSPVGLGTNIPSGAGRATVPRDATRTEKPTSPPPQPKPAVKPPVAVQEKKVAEPIPPQEQVKPVEIKQAAVKVEPEKTPTKQSEKKPESKKTETAPVAEKVVVKSEEKKPETKKTEAKPTPEKTAPQAEPKKVATTPPPSSTPNVANNPSSVSADERDKKILAALDRIRKQVQEKEEPSGRGSGSGPPTIGGAPGEGGGGVVRGLEFIMYTEQVKRRVKESWIVAEKKTGLSAVVRFGVQPDGQIFAVELLRPSGDRAFDESTLRAVRNASPLPPPPQAYVQEFTMQKVEVSFGGEERPN